MGGKASKLEDFKKDKDWDAFEQKLVDDVTESKLFEQIAKVSLNKHGCFVRCKSRVVEFDYQKKNPFKFVQCLKE